MGGTIDQSFSQKTNKQNHMLLIHLEDKSSFAGAVFGENVKAFGKPETL